jgi:hypothetical protein
MQLALRVILIGAGGFATTSAFAANLVENPNFDTNLDGWTITDGDGSIALDTSTGSPAAPSIHVKADGSDASTSVSSSCMAVDDSGDFDLYVDVNGTTGSAIASIAAFSDADCTTALDTTDGDALPAAGSWSTYSMTGVTLPDGTQSARVVLTATSGSTTDDGDVNFDHVAFGPSGDAFGSININQEGLSGTWYNPATSGQGMQFAFSPDDSGSGEGSMFGAWYTYDIASSGNASSQRWYSMQSTMSGDGESQSVTIYQNTGGNFDAAPVTSAVAVGTGTIAFDSCDSGEFTYALDDGRSGSIPLRRTLPNVDCVTSGTPTNPAGDFGLTGTWYNPATGGQGMMVEVNPSDSQVFLGWYTYDIDGEGAGVAGQRWFSAQAPAYEPGDRTIDLLVYESTGGVFDSSTGTIATLPVGTAKLTFTSCTAATFDYTFDDGDFDGKSGTIPLTRLGPTPAASDDSPQ